MATPPACREPLALAPSTSPPCTCCCHVTRPICANQQLQLAANVFINLMIVFGDECLMDYGSLCSCSVHAC